MSSRVRTRWVLLDAMGVVFPVGDDVGELLLPFIRRRVDVASDVVEANYLKATLGRTTSREFWVAVGLASAYPAVETEYLESSFQLNHGVAEALQALSDSAVKVGLVSNDVSEWSRHLGRVHGLERWLECTVVSGDVGYRKPSPRIFEHFLQSTSARARDCVAVDDRPANLRAAASLGIAGILFGPERMHEWPGLSVDSFLAIPEAVQAALQGGAS